MVFTQRVAQSAATTLLSMPPDTPRTAPFRLNCLNTRSRIAFEMRSTSLADRCAKGPRSEPNNLRFFPKNSYLIPFKISAPPDGLRQNHSQASRSRLEGKQIPFRGLALLGAYLDGALADFPVSVLGSDAWNSTIFGHHEILEPCRAMAKHILLGDLRARADGKHGLNRAAQNRVGHPNDGNLRHPIEGVDDVFDLARADLLAPRFDDVILAADKIEVSFFICAEQITTVEDSFPGQRARPSDNGPSPQAIPNSPSSHSTRGSRVRR